MVHGDSGSGADEGQRNPEGGNGFDVQAAVQQAEQHHVDHGQDRTQDHQAGHTEHCEQVHAANGRGLLGHAAGVSLDAMPCPVPDRHSHGQHGQCEDQELPHRPVPVVRGRHHLVQHDADQDGQADGGSHEADACLQVVVEACDLVAAAGLAGNGVGHLGPVVGPQGQPDHQQRGEDRQDVEVLHSRALPGRLEDHPRQHRVEGPGGSDHRGRQPAQYADHEDVAVALRAPIGPACVAPPEPPPGDAEGHQRPDRAAQAVPAVGPRGVPHVPVPERQRIGHHAFVGPPEEVFDDHRRADRHSDQRRSRGEQEVDGAPRSRQPPVHHRDDEPDR